MKKTWIFESSPIVDWRHWSLGFHIMWFQYFRGFGIDVGPFHFNPSWVKEYDS